MCTISLAAGSAMTVGVDIIFPVKADSVRHMDGSGMAEWHPISWQTKRI